VKLHIVNLKSSYNGNTTVGVADSEGLAALGFFIEVSKRLLLPLLSELEKTEQDETGHACVEDTDLLPAKHHKRTSVDMASGLTLDALLEGVDRTKYYRYLGSLTTPACNEAVVWTVFKDSIKVSKDLVSFVFKKNRFSENTLHVTKSGNGATAASLALTALSFILLKL
uniref:Alpha-carbonic anhydrase domain-containing protein n=1 Tax=Takifugu rubripes TaxID=31033 RepID=A0A674MS51_TAKRU